MSTDITKRTTINLKIPNISCHHCISTITRELEELDGVKVISVDIESKKVEVSYSPPISEEQIKNLLIEINYPPL